MYHFDWQTAVFCVFVATSIAIGAWAVLGRLQEIEDVPEEDGQPIVSVDFDGVLHSFESGWCGITEIPDKPVPGAIVWLRRLVEYGGLSVCVYGYRSRTKAGKIGRAHV